MYVGSCAYTFCLYVYILTYMHIGVTSAVAINTVCYRVSHIGTYADGIYYLGTYAGEIYVHSHVPKNEHSLTAAAAGFSGKTKIINIPI